jgi:hypothetical protein
MPIAPLPSLFCSYKHYAVAIPVGALEYGQVARAVIHHRAKLLDSWAANAGRPRTVVHLHFAVPTDSVEAFSATLGHTLIPLDVPLTRYDHLKEDADPVVSRMMDSAIVEFADIQIKEGTSSQDVVDAIVSRFGALPDCLKDMCTTKGGVVKAKDGIDPDDLLFAWLTGE